MLKKLRANNLSVFRMKKKLVLLNSLFFAAAIFAQQPVDYLIRAKAFIESGKTNEAIILLSEGLLKNQDYRFFIERGEAYMAGGDYIKAANDYLSANAMEVYSGDYGLARIFAMKGDAVNSLKHLEKNISSLYKKSEKEIKLDAAFSLIENTPDWRQFWKKERYSIFERKISEIEYYISVGKTEDAVTALNELVIYNNDDSDTQYAKSLVRFSQGKYGESITELTKLLDSDKKNVTYLRLLAKAQTYSGNPSGASQSYSNMIDMGVADAGLFMLRADCYNKTGETDRAIRDVTKYLELYPENRAALSFAGKIVAQAGDNLKALEYFSRNLKLHPDDPECFIDRGNSYFVSKTWDYAISDYSMALDIRPSDSETWINKGVALLNSGKTDDACHDFRMALTLGNKKATILISRNCIK
jgi:tetratricopeptide (TPR) repeat protein